MPDRKPQIDEIGKALDDRGFLKVKDGVYSGALDCEEFGIIPIKLELLPDFPATVPVITVVRKNLPNRIPHCKDNGKLCLFNKTGLLIDTSRPVAVIDATLKRAKDEVLLKGFRRENKDDFIKEFNAYWKPKGHLRSICNPFWESREVFLTDMKGIADEKYIFAADSTDEIKNWCRKLNHTPSNLQKAYLISFKKSFVPPDFEEALTNNDFYRLIREYSSEEDAMSFDKWLFHNSIPTTVLISVPSIDDRQRIVAAVKIEKAKGKDFAKAHAGFRTASRAPGAKEFHATKLNPTSKIAVSRLDQSFIMPRGGGNVTLSEKRVVVIGGGAIGSRVVEKLASVGLGSLRIIDNDDFAEENLHRHMLGIDDLGQKKAEALCKMLDRRFPGQSHEFRNDKIEDILGKEPSFLSESDLVLITVGDDNLEFLLNDHFPKDFPRMHVWVEPLGIGGHILQKTSKAKGCFRCIFQRSEKYGVVNRSSFVESGQDFQKSFSGCSGVFTPFSALDADKAANEAVRRTVDYLTGVNNRNALVSWLCRKTPLKQSGFALSNRGKIFNEDELKEELDFINVDCEYCSK